NTYKYFGILWNKLVFSNRFHDWSLLQPSAIIDGTDCPILEPRNQTWKVKRKFYSQKLGGPALKYLIAIHCETAEIVWASEAYPGGTYEPAIVSEELEPFLETGEKLLADRLFRNFDLYVTALP